MSLLLFPIYCFVNLNFICDNNNLCLRLSFHFTYDTDEEIIRNIFVNNFKRCDIDVNLPLHLHVLLYTYMLYGRNREISSEKTSFPD